MKAKRLHPSIEIENFVRGNLTKKNFREYLKENKPYIKIEVGLTKDEFKALEMEEKDLDLFSTAISKLVYEYDWHRLEFRFVNHELPAFYKYSVNITVSDHEYNLLTIISEEYNLSIKDVIRSAILNYAMLPS